MATLQNIGILKYRGKDGNWHPLPVVLQSSGGGSGGISTTSGKGQPGTSTVGRLNQLYRDESTDKLYICTSDTDGSYTWAAVVSDTENAVTYTAQTLTNAQKQQARANIGAGTSNFSGSYNDLTDKPNIPAASVIDTTLTQSGQAADAKAVGDALANKANTADVNSALANKADSATLTTELAKKANTTDIPSVPAWALAASKPTYTAAEVGALPNTTVIPDVSGKVDKAQGAANAGKFMGVGSDGNITPVDKPTYTLPIAAANVLGGVKPVEKTTAMTQDVGVDSAGKLYTAPSSGGSGETWELIQEIPLQSDVLVYVLGSLVTYRKIRMNVKEKLFTSNTGHRWLGLRSASSRIDMVDAMYAPIVYNYGYALYDVSMDNYNAIFTGFKTNNKQLLVGKEIMIKQIERPADDPEVYLSVVQEVANSFIDNAKIYVYGVKA